MRSMVNAYYRLQLSGLSSAVALGGDTGSAVPVFSRPPHTQSEQRREQREANTVRTCPTTGLCRLRKYVMIHDP
jgi:hypothetical protein